MSLYKPELIVMFLTAVVTEDGVYILDLAAKIDATADYICKVKWGDVEFPPPFGREAYPEASDRWNSFTVRWNSFTVS